MKMRIVFFIAHHPRVGVAIDVAILMGLVALLWRP